MKTGKRRVVLGLFCGLFLAAGILCTACCCFRLVCLSQRGPGQLFHLDRRLIASYTVTDLDTGESREFREAADLDRLTEHLNGYRYSYVCAKAESGRDTPYQVSIRYLVGWQEDFAVLRSTGIEVGELLYCGDTARLAGVDPARGFR